MSATQHELETIFRDNPDLSVVIGGTTPSVLLSIHREVDSNTRLSVTVCADMFEVTRYVTGKRGLHAYVLLDSPTPQKGTGLKWTGLEDKLGIDLAEIHNLVRLGLRVEELYEGPLFLDRDMSYVGTRVTDLINSHGRMWVSPKYKASVESRCARMRALVDKLPPFK